MFRQLLAVIALLAATTQVGAAQQKTWYVYCEGHGHGTSWAVFSQNFWQKSETENYGRRVGSAAEEFFEARHDLSLEGCSGVQFFDPTSAKYSRDRTVRLHKKLGDQVYFFTLPDTVLPE